MFEEFDNLNVDQMNMFEKDGNEESIPYSHEYLT